MLKTPRLAKLVQDCRERIEELRKCEYESMFEAVMDILDGSDDLDAMHILGWNVALLMTSFCDEHRTEFMQDFLDIVADSAKDIQESNAQAEIRDAEIGAVGAIIH